MSKQSKKINEKVRDILLKPTFDSYTDATIRSMLDDDDSVDDISKVLSFKLTDVKQRAEQLGFILDKYGYKLS